MRFDDPTNLPDTQDEAWFADFQREAAVWSSFPALAQTTRCDETALMVRIKLLEEDCRHLRQKVAALEADMNERLDGIDSRLRS